MRVVLRALIEHDVCELRLDLFHPGQVILGKGKRLLWVVLELDRVLVRLEVLA